MKNPIYPSLKVFVSLFTMHCNGAPKPAGILLHWNVMMVQKNAENIAYVNFVSSVSLIKAGSYQEERKRNRGGIGSVVEL